jgi:hypothetical protein
MVLSGGSLFGIEIMTIVHDVLLGFGFVLLWVAVVLVVFLSCFLMTFEYYCFSRCLSW